MESNDTMIKLPKEIAHMIKIIEDAGFEAYAVGGCVRDSVLGRRPEDWDLTSNASGEILGALFPDASIVNKKLGVMRISWGEFTADIAAYRIDGEYKDYRRPETVIFTQNLEEDLKRRDFTMNAIAVNPVRGIVDPYHGMTDIDRKLIRGIGNPCLRFEEDALRILRGIRFAAQLGFKIDDETLQAMKEKADLLAYISVERIREELFKTILAPNSGEGLALLMETGALRYIVGDDCIRKITVSELEKLELLAENIEQTEGVLSLRLALLYLCFEKSRAAEAIKILGYSNEMNKKLQLAVSQLEEFNSISGGFELKKLINKIGLVSYEYLTCLSSQQCRVYAFDEQGLSDKMALLETIRKNNEPIFIEDLAVKGDDLKRIGINEGIELGNTLKNLLDVVHKNPQKNRKKTLIQIAEDRNLKGSR